MGYFQGLCLFTRGYHPNLWQVSVDQPVDSGLSDLLVNGQEFHRLSSAWDMGLTHITSLFTHGINL